MRSCMYLYVCVFVSIYVRVCVCVCTGRSGKEFEQERKTRDEMDKIFKQVTATMITKKTTNREKFVRTHQYIYI